MPNPITVITGASAGIGAALARLLGARGHKLVLAARRESELQTLASEIGNGAIAVAADVTKRADVERLRDAALAAFGRIDIWINNAGRGISKQVLDLTDEDVDEMITVNLKSALYGMQAAVPHFKERGTGHLINVSSFLAVLPYATFRSAYSASKAALNNLTASLRMELLATHPGINLSVVMPGRVDTAFPQNALHGTAAMPGGPGAIVQTADEVAAVIAGVIDEPFPVVCTQAGQPFMAVRYVVDAGAVEWHLVTRR
jgi:short-subunit dehydrogenase